MAKRKRFQVVVQVCEASSIGNLALTTHVYLDPQAKGLPADSPALPLPEALKLPQLMLYLRAPVFRVGELLVLDEDGNDQFGRDPGKWDVECQRFQNADDAIAAIRALSRKSK
jgi:hypothetical protein